MVGRTISHYRILEKLGEGGMGVVYKAEDTRLMRTVALKFLPHGLDAHEPERARFLQEARAAAILNHPNICTVYDIQESEGQQFILMEYVEGKTLREVIPVKKMQEAVAFAIKIAEALQEAHAKGIVHRDVKAENIMVNSRNEVKVMDFGLAKLKGSLKLTKTSSTVGTLAYMAPEQLQGGEVDARNDIFSFGVVLYEMLTGHLPFRGEHEAAMMYSILNEEPVSLLTYLPAAPSELVHVVNRALEKDPEERYQTVHEMLIDLRRVRKDSARVSHQVPAAEAHPHSEVPPASVGGVVGKKRWLWLAAVGVVVLGVGLTLLLFPNAGGVKLNPNHTFSTLALPFTKLWYPSISRDGNWVVFPAADENDRWDIYWVNVAGGEPLRITREWWVEIDYVDISPDARQVVFQGVKDPGSQRLMRIVPLQGGTISTLSDTGGYGRWRPDGKRIGYLRVKGQSASGKFEIWSVKPDGSDNRIEFIDTLNSIEQRITFSWSPDGSSIAWVRNFSAAYGEVMVRELATGRERQLTHDRAQVDEVIWPASDRIVFISNRSGHANLWAIPSGGGEAVKVTEGATPIYGAKMSADARRLVYLQQEQFSHLWVSPLDGSNARQLTFDEILVGWAIFSPDGNQVACALGAGDIYRPEAHLCVMDREGKNRRELTSGSEIVGYGLWSPDGRWLSYVSRSVGEPEDSNRVYLIQPSDPRPRLVSSGGLDERPRWSPDGKWLAYASRSGGEPKDSSRVYLIEPSKAGVPRFLANGVPLQWSDSVTCLVQRRDTTYWQYVITGGVPRRVPKDSTFFPFLEKVGKRIEGRILGGYAFSPDWKTLLYHLAGSNEVWRLRASGGNEERIGVLPSKTMHILDVSRNGKELLLLQDKMRSKLALIENLFE